MPLKMALAVAGVNKGEEDRAVAIAINALKTLSGTEREAVLAEYEVPAVVALNLEADLPWPEPMPLVDHLPASEVDLEAYRAWALERVNAITAKARAPLLTDIPGQEMLYLRKAEEAKRFVGLTEVPTDLKAAGFKFLADEVGVSAATAEDLAALWLEMDDQWSDLAAAMERPRLTAAAAIRGAEAAPEIAAALEAFEDGISGDQA
ncbi:hypothetical protein R2601_22786 [Salipiger bermudensis HTCC2601]|uniref:Uncharacterized protein n=1 Tax=Salipiger bermudensis (strain DSM 26914 / JCM 13377 / KCTC 12554 / HTCC2601) TaxID=314265 RepID=Q0FLN6_SALBH|nr:hypothetical protein R2601_22786 [Salipiger bermudensis HTCC2601]